MSSSVWLDVSSLGILMVLFLIYQYRWDIPIRRNKLLLGMSMLTFLSTLSDFVCGLFVEGFLVSTNWGYYLAKTGLLFSQSTTTFLYLLYVYEVLNVNPRRRVRFLMWNVPYAILIVLLAVSLYIQDNSLLEGVSIMDASLLIKGVYLITILFMGMGFASILRFRKSVTKLNGVILSSYILFAFLGPVWQTIDPNIRISSFTLTVSMLLMYLTIQNPEDIIDGESELLNRKGFNELLQNTINTGQSRSIVLVGIEDYTFYQELLGRSMMKEMILSRLAKFKDISRHIDAFRISDSQFTVLLKDASDQTIDKLFQKVADNFDTPWVVGGVNYSVRGYATIVNYPSDFKTVEQFLSIAEQLEREEKSWNQEHPNFATAMLDKKDISRKQEITRLVRSITPDKLLLRFHGSYSVERKRIDTMEISVDLKTTAGIIRQNEYLPIAEQGRTAFMFNDFLISQACMLLGSGYLAKRGIRQVSVTLSAGQWLQVGLVDKITQFLEQNHADPGALYLKIDESVKNAAPENVMKTLQGIVDAGIGIAIEKYGVGYNDLSKDFLLPKAVIGIDSCFLEENRRAEGADSIVRNAISLFKRFGYKTHIDGISTSEERNQYIAMGCDYLSGPLFGKDEYITPLQEGGDHV